ncbi:MAG: DUF3540 domain-containing protein [Burkholderiales bacterium]|nr:DUF3540 domain-containing protein [Burkholderiales bacterium]
MGAHDLNLHAATADAGPWIDAVGAQSLAVSFAAELIAADEDGRYAVRSGQQRYAAQRALSCLVAPEPGDRVACWRVAEADGADSVFIVAVLARQPGGQGVRLQLDAGAELSAHDGTLTLRATKAVQVHTGSCEVQAEQLQVQAQSVSFVYRTLQSIGELCSATLGQLKLVGASLSTVFDQETHHAQQHHRVTEGLDMVDAKVIRHQAEDLMHLQAESLLANGDRLVKMRGTQIHLG